jgi:hypothetical protein
MGFRIEGPKAPMTQTSAQKEKRRRARSRVATKAHKKRMVKFAPRISRSQSENRREIDRFLMKIDKEFRDKG